MTTGQIISIIVSVIITSIIVTFSIVSNKSKIVNDNDLDVNDGGTKLRDDVSEETFSLQDIIKSVTNN